MKRKLNLLLSSCALCLLASCGPTNNNVCTPTGYEDNKVHLVILAGQSGARGKAVNTDLTDEEKVPFSEVDIIEDGYQMSVLSNIPSTLSTSTMFKELKPGFGDSGGEFGPELGMGLSLQTRYQKDGEGRKSGIVKFTACGSTFISDWYSESSLEDETISSKLDTKQVRTNEKLNKETGPLTNNLYQLIDKAIDDLDQEGYEAVIDGVVFSHGEQDAKFDVNMEIYESCLRNFIKDVRSYVGNDTLPFVIGEAKTNSAKYSNKLRSIQEKVANDTTNTILLDAMDLETNTFEPWHMGARSNIEFGKRAVEEIIKFNDTRKIDTIEDSDIYVPLNKKVELPKYLNASYTSGYEGLVTPIYEDYDETKEGVQEVKIKTKINCEEKDSTVKVHVGNYPFVDGIIDEEIYQNSYDLPSSLGKIYVGKSDLGLALGAKINDTDIWTDGEQWKVGDMGQKGRNDDLRMYITDSSPSEKYTVCLSSANLLRVYDSAVDLLTSKDTELVKHNLIYQKQISGIKHNVTTFGDVNGGNNTNLDFEMFIPYDALGYDENSTIKVLFGYSNISSSSSSKKEDRVYVGNEASSDSAIEDIAKYITL